MLVQCPKCAADVETNGGLSQLSDCPECGESFHTSQEELQTQIISAIERPTDEHDGLHTERNLKTNSSGADAEPDDGNKSRRFQVRCPGCAAPIDTGADDSLQDVTCPSCGSNFNLIASTETVGYKQPANETIGHFSLQEQVGVGQFGTVWKAKDTNLDRTVAIKVPRKGQLDERETEQFLREARAAAQLKHPNIVSVHEVGRSDESVYIVSDFVNGVTLSDWLTGQTLTPREAAELCVKIGEALEHAHAKGVVHRDLKPGNIMMTADGEPHIMDFGLAKRETGEVTMTTDGQVLGTPAYMSPEQARGDAHSADRRADVYSLGVVLFELLTGERPFRGNSRMILHQVLNEDAPSPRKLNIRVPRDLETICLKCLEKEPQRRYSSAGDVAEELRRFLRDEPLRARPVSTTARFIRWCKRKPVIASLSLTSLALLFVVAIGAPLAAWYQADLRETAEQNAVEAKASSNRALDLSQQAEKDRYRARTKVLEAYEHLAESRYNQARVLWNDRTGNRQQLALEHLAEAGKLADEARKVAGSLDTDPDSWKKRTEQFWTSFTPRLRSEAVRWLTQTSAQELARPPAIKFPERPPDTRFTATQPSFALSPDGGTLAVYRARAAGDATPSIDFIRTVSGTVEKSIPLKLHRSKRLYWTEMAYSPDGSELMILRADRIGLFGVTSKYRVQYLNPKTGKSRFVTTTGGQSSSFTSYRPHVQFSADRKRILTQANRYQLTQIFSTETGKHLASSPANWHVCGITADGQQLVAHDGRRLRVIPLSDKRKLRLVETAFKPASRSYDSIPRSLVDPQGDWLAVFHTNRPYSSRRQFKLRLYNLKTGELQVERLLHSVYRASTQRPDIVRAFSPDGRLLAVASGDWFYLFSVPDGGLLFSKRHPDITPNVKTKRNYYSGRAPWEPIGITFSANGARIALSLKQMEPRVENGKRFMLQVWDVAAGEVPEKSLAHDGRVASMSFGKGNAPLISSGEDGVLRAWTKNGDRKWEAGFTKNERTGGNDDGFDPTGKVYVRHHLGRIDVWDVATGRLLKRFARDSVVATTDNRKYFAVRTAKGGPRIYDLSNDRDVAKFNWPQATYTGAFVFSSDLKHLANTSSGKSVYIGRIADGKTVVRAENNNNYAHAQIPFSPTGKFAIVSRQDMQTNRPMLAIWNLKAGKKVATWEGTRQRYTENRFEFSPDEKAVAFTTRDSNNYNRRWVAVWHFADSMSQKKTSLKSSASKQKKPTGKSPVILLGKPWNYEPDIYWPTKNRMLVRGQRRMGGQTRYFAELWDLSKQKLLAAAQSYESRSRDSILVGRSTAAVRIAQKHSSVTDVWDLKTGNRLGTWQGQPMQLSSDRKLLFINPPRLVEMNTGREIQHPKGSLLSLSNHFSKDNAGFLTRNVGTGKTMIWQTAPRKTAGRQPLKSFLRMVLAVDTRMKELDTDFPVKEAISPDGKYLVTYSRRNNKNVLKLWNLVEAKLEREIPVDTPHNRHPGNTKVPVDNLSFSPDGKRIAFSIYHQTRFADVATGKLIQSLDRSTHTFGVNSTAVSTDGRLTASASQDRTVCLWHTKGGRFAGMLYGFSEPVRQVAFPVGGNMLITRDARGEITGWKYTVDGDKKKAQVIRASIVWRIPAQAERLVVHPNKPWFATGHLDGKIEFRDARTGKVTATIQNPGGILITALAFAPEGDRVASVDGKGVLRLWNVKTRKLIRAWQTSQGTVNAVDIANRNGLIATAGNGTSLWHVDFEHPLTVLGKANNVIRTAKFNVIGDILATGGDDHRVHLLDLKRLREHLAPLKLAW